MIVTRSNFESTLASLSSKAVLALDTETTGLRPHHGHKLFSVIINDGGKSYYFNFNNYPGLDPANTLTREWIKSFADLFRDEKCRWVFHNAKFDLAMLANAGLEAPWGPIHDTMCIARVLDSTLFPNQFSLDVCASKIGFPKSDVVKAFLQEARLYTEEKTPGKKTTKKNLHYDQVPFDLIVPYGERDAEITFKLAEYQLAELKKLDGARPAELPPVAPVYENECQLVRTVFEMEARGVLIDRDFCRRAIANAEITLQSSVAKFETLTGEPFKDSNVVYQRVFAGDKDRWVYGKKTATGKTNPSFDGDVLATFEHPAAKCVLEWRKAKSDANFYLGFLYEADAAGVIHASFNQHATATGRFSSSNPNLQNLTKDEDEALEKEFVVRRAIIPRPGCFFAMFDMAQAEYRLMLDYAARFADDRGGVLRLIDGILGGLDVHQATASLAGISRREAKTVNFAILYGSGVASLSDRLGVTQERARAIRDSIFRAAPEIASFIRRATTTAENRGYIANWFGRQCQFPDPRFAYRATNYLIQGGVADIVKIGMNRLDAFLTDKATKMVLTVHDEIICEGPSEEAHLVPRMREILEGVYPHRFLPLTWDVDHSFKSLADRQEGLPPCNQPTGVSSADYQRRA